MPVDHFDPARGRKALGALVGEWEQRLLIPDAPVGRVVFEWALDGSYLLERSTNPHPEFPDSLSIISCAEDDDAYTQHYFDSRGVVRVYRMTLRDGDWTLLRTDADFTPLAFAQRFVGTSGAGGDTIDGRWERSHDGGAQWEFNFGLVLTRVR